MKSLEEAMSDCCLSTDDDRSYTYTYSTSSLNVSSSSIIEAWNAFNDELARLQLKPMAINVVSTASVEILDEYKFYRQMIFYPLLVATQPPKTQPTEDPKPTVKPEDFWDKYDVD